MRNVWKKVDPTSSMTVSIESSSNEVVAEDVVDPRGRRYDLANGYEWFVLLEKGDRITDEDIAAMRDAGLETVKIILF